MNEAEKLTVYMSFSAAYPNIRISRGTGNPIRPGQGEGIRLL